MFPIFNGNCTQVNILQIYFGKTAFISGLEHLHYCTLFTLSCPTERTSDLNGGTSLDTKTKKFTSVTAVT